jgi:hypothetical protein
MGERQSGNGGRLRKIGAMWAPKPGAKSLGSGSVTINGMRQRFVVFRNDRKTAGSSEPDYTLLSGDEPEADTYAQRQALTPDRRRQDANGAEPFDPPF